MLFERHLWTLKIYTIKKDYSIKLLKFSEVSLKPGQTKKITKLQKCIEASKMTAKNDQLSVFYHTNSGQNTIQNLA